MADFTLKVYERLVRSLIAGGFTFLTFEEYLKNPAEKSVVLRHDVDLLPENAFAMAEIEARLGVVASYHFRIVKQSFDREIVIKIASLGHEIAYHYEDMINNTTCRSHDSEVDPIEIFRENLETIRQIAPVKVISMHGNPKSKQDSRDIWKEHNYSDFGVVCEPYFDIDYSRVLYLTDTGRCWNGDKYNVRDKVRQGFGNTVGRPLNEIANFRSTHDLIISLERKQLPNHLILNAHPQRWNDKPLLWAKELLWQNIKNVVKYFIIVARNYARKT